MQTCTYIPFFIDYIRSEPLLAKKYITVDLPECSSKPDDFSSYVVRKDIMNNIVIYRHRIFDSCSINPTSCITVQPYCRSEEMCLHSNVLRPTYIKCNVFQISVYSTPTMFVHRVISFVRVFDQQMAVCSCSRRQFDQLKSWTFPEGSTKFPSIYLNIYLSIYLCKVALLRLARAQLTRSKQVDVKRAMSSSDQIMDQISFLSNGVLLSNSVLNNRPQNAATDHSDCSISQSRVVNTITLYIVI